MFFFNGNVIDDLRSLKEEKVVLFPASDYTRMLLKYQKPKNVYCICDNNAALKGKRIDGIPIFSPEKLLHEPGEFWFVISESRFAREIVAQLRALGLQGRCKIVISENGWVTAEKFYDPFKFEDRRSGSGKLLAILAGFKPKLWSVTLKRIACFLPKGIDVCMMSAGKRDETLGKICADNGWSYLSTQRNSIPLIQNVAIMLHPEAEYIYKLDEDMFVCEGFFEGLLDTYRHAEERSRHHVGLVAPLIPVNPHGYVRFMEALGCIEEFDAKFGKAYYGYNPHFNINTQQTLFLWEKTLPLDKTAKSFKNMPFSYFICPHHFSIGAILFKRAVWEEMRGFEVGGGIGLGRDEDRFAEFFLTQRYYSIVMAENVLAGHYSFGMIDDPEALGSFYERNIAGFDVIEE